MLKTPELAMPRTNKVTTVCNGRREVWADYEEAKAYFLEIMMSTDGEEHERAYILKLSITLDTFPTRIMKRSVRRQPLCRIFGASEKKSVKRQQTVIK